MNEAVSRMLKNYVTWVIMLAGEPQMGEERNMLLRWTSEISVEMQNSKTLPSADFAKTVKLDYFENVIDRKRIGFEE